MVGAVDQIQREEPMTIIDEPAPLLGDCIEWLDLEWSNLSDDGSYDDYDHEASFDAVEAPTVSS